MYDSPPRKSVGLKFCWVVLSCPKRFFVKKIIGRVNPGRGGGDDPPQKLVGLNCVGLLLVLLPDAA